MPTPARNVSFWSNSSDQGYWKKMTGPTGYPWTRTIYSSQYRTYKRDVRPASITKPWVGSPRWRYPTAWNHEVINLTWHCSQVDTQSKTDSRVLGKWTSPTGPISYTEIRDKLLVLPSFSSNLENRSIAEALDKLKAQKIHLGNFFGTWQETAEMLGRAAAGIAGSVGRWRRANPSKWGLVKAYEPSRKRDWCKIPNSWLELQYGWIPLMQDLLGAMSQLESGFRQAGLVVEVQRTIKRNDKIYDTLNGFDSQNVNVMRNIKSLSKCCLWYRLRNQNLAALSSLGLINPLEIVWEVLKYSFVVDWFLPLGTWMSSLTGDVGFDFISGTQTRMQKLEDVRAYSSTSGAGSVDKLLGGIGLTFPTFDHVKMSRSVYTSSPVPGFYLKNPLSMRHTLNSLALLAQAFK